MDVRIVYHHRITTMHETLCIVPLVKDLWYSASLSRNYDLVFIFTLFNFQIYNYNLCQVPSNSIG